MRTTLDIDGTVLAQLKVRQREVGGTLGALASQLLARALDDGPTSGSEPWRWATSDMGARVDLEDADAVERAADQSR